MKRVGHVYEQMAVWENIVEAEKVSTRRKMRNCGVIRHVENRWKNLVEIQRMILEGRMKTSKYTHERRISGQDKMRDIAKLRFHPSHIEHQLLTLTANGRIDKSLIRHTYASRKGYGQIRCALHIKKCLGKYRGQVRWYAQGDIRKYYDSIQHSIIRQDLERLFKDGKFVDAFIEPFEVFAPEGKAIPLGIRPSQSTGNLTLSSFDHYMTEQVKAEDYTRYLDDFMFTGATKGEVKRKMRRAEKFLSDKGFVLHEPKIHRISEGLDMMGFVYYGNKGDMWWRKKDKVRWLRRRAKVSNPKRLRELDDAAWGMLKWGNNHCNRLWEKKTGRISKKNMSVRLTATGIKRTERLDANGVPFINAPKIGMQMLLDKEIECDMWVKGVRTSQGDGRYALRITFMGNQCKLIVNAVDIKSFLDDMTRHGVSRFRTVFIDRGSMHYSVDENRTEILEVRGRKVSEKDGMCVYDDTGEIVDFNNQNV